MERVRASVNVHGRVLRGLIRGGDTSEVGDGSGTSLGVKSFDITGLANFQGSADMAFVELKSSSLVSLLGKVSILTVWGNESNEYDLSSKAEEFGDLSDTTDVLSTVFGGESKILVETSSDDIAIKKENLL